ncbi:MAG TPA: response regulator transcription factor [Chthonomonadaceae bacterium]|nr:response regulator transcription factor [Chthonomonadaceae bacterium]
MDEKRFASSLPRIRIGVAESDTLLCEGLEALLNTVEEFDCIGAWSQLQEVFTALPELHPDILLIDIQLLRATDLECLNDQLTLNSTLRLLLMMSGSDAEQETARRYTHIGQHANTAPEAGGQSGICGLVSKRSGFREINAHIRRAYHEAHALDPEAMMRLVETYLSSHHPDLAAEGGGEESLTSREWQVVWLIGQGRSNKEIALKMRLEYSTVKNYVSSILKKLQLNGRTQIALFAHQRNGMRSLPLTSVKQ